MSVKNRTKSRRPVAKSGRRKSSSAVAGFRPYVAQWFRKTFKKPSPAQAMGWPVIRRGDSTLLLAPTGSGKTLAAFMCAIDDLFRRGEQGDLPKGIHVLYITPLKALGNDIHKNLLEPLAGIRKDAGGSLPQIRVAVRTGDTPQSERARMIRRPPHILITTPESLYLLLGSPRMSEALRSIRTVIVDEVHALCDNKRGVHLSVSLERLEARVDGVLQRVGCSATLNPLEDIAGFLVGYDETGRRPCTIVNAGMRKNLDVQVMAPLRDFLEASNSALWSSAYELLLEEISRHRTTLVFTNSRYKAERTALRLGEAADEKTKIGAHHGSLSKETRLRAEDALKEGRLDALVATSSLELGIDIGSVDIVYQLESPKSVTTGLQRVGRAGHLLDATSKGRLLIFERDELLEAAAISKAMFAGEVDAVRIPQGCLDVLAQQIVGAVAARDCGADELFVLIRRACPYKELSREQFDAVLGMLAGEHPFQMANAPRPLILWDRAAGRLSPTRSSAHVSAMCVGTIPETSEYDVVISSSNKRVGRVQSGFVDDSLRTGDVFVLGSSSWRMVGVRKNRLLVEEAPGSTPTVPWWLGPVESRTSEVGARVGELRREVASALHDPNLAARLQKDYRLCPYAAEAIIDYVREQQLAAGLVPDEHRLLVETWRDELGRLNVIVHSPYGSRINRTWGIAVVSAVKENFGQDWTVSASNDVLLLTRRETEAPPLHNIDARELLAAVCQESLLDVVKAGAQEGAGIASSFRDAATCSFQILRAWRGNRVPLWLQNHRAAELYEVAHGHPEYPVTAEVVREYMSDSLDVPGLERLLGRIEEGKVEVVFRNVESPSPFAQSLLIQDRYQTDHRMGRDRRAHLLRLHRQVLQEVLTSEQMAHLLDARAIEKLESRLLHRLETTRAATSDELVQVIRDLGDLPAAVEALAAVTDGNAVEMLLPLVREARVVGIRLPECEGDPVRLVSADLWRQFHDAFALGRKGERLSLLLPKVEDGAIVGFDSASAAELIPARWRKKMPQSAARAAVVERYLKCHGPVTQYEIMNHTGWPIGAVEAILKTLVRAGKVARGVYTSTKPAPQWVDRANLEEIHRLTMRYLKRELAACAPYEVVDFMTRWQHLHPDTRLRGLDGLRQVIRQLQGVEIVQGALETEVLPGRVADYRPELLDRLVASGEVCWRRVSTKAIRRGMLTLCLRKDMHWLAGASPLQFDVEEKADCDIADTILAVRTFFRDSGPAFFDDVLDATGLEEGAVMRAVWYLAWCGELTCDTFECVRHAHFRVTLSACYDLMHTPREIMRGRDSHERVLARMKRRKLNPRLGHWAPTERLALPKDPLPESDVVRRWAHQLLARWGIVTRSILAAEVAAPSWATLLREFKRLELLGKVSRGYFIESHQGEQYGLPEAIELLRDCRARRSDGKHLGYLTDEPLLCLTNHDPANLYAMCLDILDERGKVFWQRQRRGNFDVQFLTQAGQVLLYNRGNNRVSQLATLDWHQLVRCIEKTKEDMTRWQPQIRIRDWNGHPIDVSPVAAVLWESGFRFSSKREMCWPPRKTLDLRPPTTNQDVFLPAYLEPPPVDYGPEWFISRSNVTIRDKVRELIRLLERIVPDECEFVYGPRSMYVRYRGARCIVPRVQQKEVKLSITRPPWRPDFRITPETDLDTPDFASQLLERLEVRRHRIDSQLDSERTRLADG